ncbi:DNA-binding protein [Aliarcobacter cryaerophilus]|uniref:DNA-binding protein n=1 Tax=Aliarcobacter cryaerophilus TaxID=28198 RepID=UPI0021B5B96E|nr:DNA-binding protein [Aliarcobacter cryaerophilus]MCT7520817.1 DNA-binding protein [Aliarcobacter cryaerophilus]
MQRLVTTSEASEILGISLQGIHYRIRRNQLKSEKKDGKLFVYIDEETIKNSLKNDKQNNKENVFERVIQSKDEQIEILKKSIKWMKNQHFMEIKRLEKNQKRIIEVFNSEIKLLQSAFNEMRSIYKPQIENQKNEKKREFISLQEFFTILKRASKSDLEIKNTILNAVKNGDKRFIYNKNSKKLLILNDSFEDLL